MTQPLMAFAPRAAVPPPFPLLLARDVPHPERAVRRGELVPVRRGIYAAAAAWRSAPPWDRYLARVHAFALVHPDAVFCLESAVTLTGFPIFGDPGVVHILRDDKGTAGVGADVRVHTAANPREILDLGGLAVTAPVETAVDIARCRPPAAALAVADAVLRLDETVSVERLVATNESRASSRGHRRARWALHRATPLAESTLESVSRAAIEWLGLPEPELQHWFTSRTGERDRSDMWWRDDKVAGEADGDVKYDGRFGDATTALRGRRRRDGRLREHVRSVAHWAWDEVRDVTQLRAILLGAGVRRIRPEDTARLLELRRTLAGGIPTPPRPHLRAETVASPHGFGAQMRSRGMS
ncbi:MAG: hypothetical protein QM626_08935 [Microbacterium sp.]|uniref:hypothetical protein n=1 Tax=Microbacterium sp. TaxID=51671 RepID=UPI0039E415E9